MNECPGSLPLGLTAAGAARRLAAEGANEPGAAVKESRVARQILGWFANPLVIILLARASSRPHWVRPSTRC